MTLLFKKKPRVIVIDDDPIFLTLMMKAAKKSGFYVEIFSSLEDLGHLGSLSEFDLAIVDYQLEQMTGLEIAEYLDVFFKDIPMILVSAREKETVEMTHWPRSIKRFVSKHDGFAEVISAAKYACNLGA